MALEVVATYKTLITDISERHQKFDLNFTVDYEEDVTVPNTGANSTKDGVKNIVPIVAIVIGVGIVVIVLAKSKVKAPVKVAGMVLIGSVAISSVANALATQFVFKFDNDFMLKSLLEVKYTVRSETGTVVVPYGDTLPIADPEVTGYDFDGWETPDGDDVSKTEPIVDDMEIIAQFTPIIYTITYDLGDGTATGNPGTYTIEDTFTLNNPTLDNYEFGGWSGTGLEGEANTEVTVPLGETGDREYVAHYEEICPQGYICYYANGGNGTMDNQAANANQQVNLEETNFDRSGYGFKGWNTKRDGSGTSYGPNQTIIMPESGVLKLYADWIASVGNIQNYSGCADLQRGDFVALTDVRDNQVYTVTKLADGNCWMTENLRLVLSDLLVPMSAENTNNPAAEFTTAVNEQHPGPSVKFETWCSDNNATCDNKIAYDTRNVSRIGADGDPSDPSPGSDYNYWGVRFARYGYGNYYNWYTATAGYGKYETTSGSVTGDICPAGWHLPTGGNNAGDEAFDLAMAVYNESGGSVSPNVLLRNFPNNFAYGGYRTFVDVYNRDNGGYGAYWTSTAANDAQANWILLEWSSNFVIAGQYKYYGNA
ncbi:MAG: InlB B-repeat-containing protein, partial [Psychrobacter sp.]|nr:InlB B-repeat-containing protein [Psychrobacter sp.]